MMVNHSFLKATFEPLSFEEKLQKLYKLNVMGAVFLMSSKLEKAEEYFKKALDAARELGINYPNLMTNLGNLYSQKREFENAREAYLTAISTSFYHKKDEKIPENENSFVNKIKEFDTKFEGLESIFCSKEAYIDSHTNMGFALLALEKPAEAFEYLQTALKLSPNSKEIQVNVGNALRQIGKREEAIDFVWKQVTEEMEKITEKSYVPKTVDPQFLKQKQKINIAEGVAQAVNFVCVKWGTRYGPDYVNKLYAGCKRHCSLQFDFYCLTEDPTGLEKNIKILPLETKFETWWTKANLFDGRLEGDRLNIYIDLDVVIVRNIDFLAKFEGVFALMKTDDIACETLNKGGYNSSIILFRGNGLRPIFETLLEVYPVLTKILFRLDYWFEMMVPDSEFVQDLWPGKIVDYLSECQKGIEGECAIVVFPRKPKPHDYPAEWVKEHWIE